MPAGTIGFKVNCGSDGSPGVDQLGTFTLLLSFKFSDMNEPVFIKVPINGQSETGAGDGDDTPEVASSAEATVASSKALGEHAGSVTIQEDGGGPGQALGRVVVNDPELESLDVSDNCQGKLDTEIVYEKGTDGPPKRLEGDLPERPEGQGGFKGTKRKGERLPPPTSSDPMAGSKEWQYLNPNRRWRRPGPYKRRPKRKKEDTRGSLQSVGDSQGMILLGATDFAPGVYVDQYAERLVLCVPFPWDMSSMWSQNQKIRDALVRAGIAAEVGGDSVAIGGLIKAPRTSFAIVGARPFVTPLPGVTTRSFPWDLVVGATAADGLVFVSARPSPLVSSYRASQISALAAIRPSAGGLIRPKPLLPVREPVGVHRVRPAPAPLPSGGQVIEPG